MPLALLAHEGGYSDDPDDDGGETKFGISKRSYPHVDVDALTVEQAKNIYKRDFWDTQLYKDIKDVNLATKFFDLAKYGIKLGASIDTTCVKIHRTKYRRRWCVRPNHFNCH
ncbi:hypothetical protein P618_200441 [Holospora obtusa F1]|uniref:TtsA-like Glycoside hydrolase family 108 domain-containing protein n=1 Tax=Holospora obtusa F1 TaxID=1399147 RepID=W6TUF9_HOLOB|nr:glycosyl hydrolase 108 family protein [Holospora obtusa]ETZ07377.1 hypothetical protein P618_200441 [Holospora obtusa F1]